MKAVSEEIRAKNWRIKGKNRDWDKEIASIYLTNKVSATLIIPIEMARRQGMDQPSRVTVEEINEGILIKKLHI
jgi:hypothetical protein